MEFVSGRVDNSLTTGVLVPESFATLPSQIVGTVDQLQRTSCSGCFFISWGGGRWFAERLWCFLVEDLLDICTPFTCHVQLTFPVLMYHFGSYPTLHVWLKYCVQRFVRLRCILSILVLKSYLGQLRAQIYFFLWPRWISYVYGQDGKNFGLRSLCGGRWFGKCHYDLMWPHLIPHFSDKPPDFWNIFRGYSWMYTPTNVPLWEILM